MTAEFQSDSRRGPGHGIIFVPGLPPAHDPRFALYRASDRQCLAQSGWQDTEFFLTPENWDADTGTLRMAVGPDVVDHLDALDVYRLLIKDGGKPVSQTMTIKDILYSRPDVPAMPAPEPEKNPDPEPPAMLVPEPPVIDVPLAMVEPPARGKNRGPLLILLLVLLALGLIAGGGLWWYVHRASQKPAAEQTRPKIPVPVPADAPATPRPVTPLQAAREHLRAGGEPVHSVALMEGMTTPEAADGAFLLAEDAARKGQAKAMLRLADFYNPVDVAPKGSIQPNAALAYDWYTKARDAGQAAANPKLGALRAWAEKAAAQGDAATKTLLEQWK